MAEKILDSLIDGKYRLLGMLGRGAMGEVYRAAQLDVEGRPLREVALKMIRPESSLDPNFSRRFLREVRVAARLRNPHTITVYDSGQTEERQVYFTMELIQGPTLREFLDRQGVLPVERAVQIVSQICLALSEAHGLSEPVVHRDLKPVNIFIEQQQGQDWVKVGDFGIAKVLGEHTSGLTQTGMSPGTPRYMAPEQWMGKAIDSRTDLYALGIILYEMLTGKPPFSADGGPMALMYQHLNDTPPPLPALVPVQIRHLVERLLAKDPNDRPATALVMKQALEAAWAQAQKVAEQATILLSEEPVLPAKTAEVSKGGAEQQVEVKQEKVVTPSASPPPPQAPRPQGEERPRPEDKKPQQREISSAGKARRVAPWVYGMVGMIAVVLVWFAGNQWTAKQEEKSIPQEPVVPTPQQLKEPPPPVQQPKEQAAKPPPQEAPAPVPQQQTKPQPPTEPPQEQQGTGGRKMVSIPAGEFWMGCSKGDQDCASDEKPGRAVNLDAFSIDKYEVTVAEYGRCVKAGKCSDRGLLGSGFCNWNQKDREDYPINCVDWNQAVAYCQWAGKRLPTEAEWEKAARAGSATVYSFGNDPGRLGEYAWYNANSGGGTHPVGQRKANTWGLYDMAGNVWEWVQDWYDEGYYNRSSTSKRNPKGPDDGQYRVLRGGSWGDVPGPVRVSDRSGGDPGDRDGGIGFRCAQ